MPYEKVTTSRGRGTAQPKISLRKSASIGVNQAALEQFFEDSEEYAEIYYDEENNKLAIVALEGETDDSLSLTRSESGGSITPASFLKGNDLVPDITTQYAPFEEDINDDTTAVAIDLDDPLGTYGSPDESEDE